MSGRLRGRYHVPVPVDHRLTVPRKYSERALDLYLSQVVQLKKGLEAHLNVEITDGSLMRSVDLYNESHSLNWPAVLLRRAWQVSERRLGLSARCWPTAE